MNIENTKPIDVLAGRVWSGTRWHYPNIEKMVAELSTLRAQVAGLEERVRLLNGFIDNVFQLWSFDNDQMHTHTWHTREDLRAEYAALTPPAPAKAAREGGAQT